MSQPFNLFEEQLAVISDTTKMLNAPRAHDDHVYIHVELRTEGHRPGEHIVVGEWSDEIGPDAWYFQPFAEPKSVGPGAAE